jgi:exoribonuclease II
MIIPFPVSEASSTYFGPSPEIWLKVSHGGKVTIFEEELMRKKAEEGDIYASMFTSFLDHIRETDYE